MKPPNGADLVRLGITRDDWQSLASLVRAQHPKHGMITGHCVCGAACTHPVPAACRTLQTLLDLAEVAERETRP